MAQDLALGTVPGKGSTGILTKRRKTGPKRVPSTRAPVTATEPLASRPTGPAGLLGTLRAPSGCQLEHRRLAQPRPQRALGVDQSACPGGRALTHARSRRLRIRGSRNWLPQAQGLPKSSLGTLSVLHVKVWGHSMLLLKAAWVGEVAPHGLSA